MSEAMNVQAKAPSQGNGSNNQIMNLEMREIIRNLKAHLPNPKKVSYVYYTMCVLTEVGIARQSEVIKAIAKVQKILNEVIGNINEFEKLLRELQNLGFGKNTTEEWKDPKNHKKGKYADWGKAWNPADHSKSQNQEQMSKQIKVWMGKKSNIPDGKGGYLNNAQALQANWKNLYGKNGLMSQLKVALNNPIYKQEEGSGYKTVMGWNESGSSLAGKDWTASDKGYSSITFLAFLQGKRNDGDGAKILAQAVCSSYYNKTGTEPKDDTTKYSDPVGDLISQDLEMGKQTLNGLNSTEAADLSMYSQNIISMIQEGQQIIKYGGQETQQYVSNQKPQ
ncbi:MAG: hypothetical protein K1060chlam4_00068 [Candidatus Anoxychlamydiales bacterium]|nr:hypothetical protein [Candidatus Anoxychlamydiales bacterium]